MNDPNLVSLSLSAFVAVLLLLSLLALVIAALARLFRERPQHDEAALLAALQATVSQQLPGYRITRVEETRAGSSS
jgi:hypothetical protein